MTDQLRAFAELAESAGAHVECMASMQALTVAMMAFNAIPRRGDISIGEGSIQASARRPRDKSRDKTGDNRGTQGRASWGETPRQSP